uniref:Uncharacterized protein n=1 Tax=Oncorhynchus kisutch TaxID=8019 RepID=A0A8C7FUZ3_ONCKI
LQCFPPSILQVEHLRDSSSAGTVFFFPPLSHPSQMKCRYAAPGGHLVSVHNNNVFLSLSLLLTTSFSLSLPPLSVVSLCGLTAPTGTPGEPIACWTSHEDCIGKWNDHMYFTKKSYMCSFKNRV